MKTILLDGNLILRGLTDEGEFHCCFVVLWKVLQSSQLQGYITTLDLARLQRQLNREIGPEASKPLLSAFERILRVWSGDRSSSIDVIVTESPQSFSEWDVPTLSVADFLKRYELDSLLKQTSEAISPLTKSPVFLDQELLDDKKLLDDKTSKAATTILLMLPFMLELWSNRGHLAEMMAAFTKTGEETEETSLKSGLASYLTAEAINVVEPLTGSLAMAALTTRSRSPSSRLLFADLPGIDISIENNLSLDVQLDRQGNAVIVRLLVPGEVAPARQTVAATIYQTNTAQAIAQLITTDAGLLIVANPSEANTHSTSTSDQANQANGQLIAVVQQTSNGSLTTWLSARSPSFARGGGTLLANPLSPTNSSTDAPVVAIRWVDRSSSPTTVSPQDGIEIRVDVEPDGTHTVTVTPLMTPIVPTVPTVPTVPIGRPELQPEGESAPVQGEQLLPTTNPSFEADYDNSWVLNDRGNFVPSYIQFPSALPWGGETALGETGDRPDQLFVEPSLEVVQVVAQYSTSPSHRDSLLGIDQGTNIPDITTDELTNGTSTRNATANVAITISLGNLGEMESIHQMQSNFVGISVLPNFAAFPSYSTPSSNQWLSTTPISSI